MRPSAYCAVVLPRSASGCRLCTAIMPSPARASCSASSTSSGGAEAADSGENMQIKKKDRTATAPTRKTYDRSQGITNPRIPQPNSQARIDSSPPEQVYCRGPSRIVQGVPASMAARARLLDLLCERVLSTRAAIGDQWPVDADRRDGKWVTTAEPDWTWGLWCESLRMVGERRKMPELREEARNRTTERADTRYLHNLYRGGAFYYSAARLAAS